MQPERRWRNSFSTISSSCSLSRRQGIWSWSFPQRLQTRVCQVLCSEPLRHTEVAQLVLVGMVTDRPLESNFFPGLLEGLLGRLDIAAPGESKPPTHPEKVLASFGHQLCMRRFYRWSREKWRHQDLLGCLNAWISIMRRISSKSEVIRCQQSSRTRFLSLAWLMWCTRHSSLQCCLRLLPPLVTTRFHLSQVSQRTVDLNQRSLNRRSLNRRSPPQAPQRPVNGSRSKSLRLLILIWTRPMSLLQRRNHLLEVSKSRSSVDSGNVATMPRQAAPKMVPLPPR